MSSNTNNLLKDMKLSQIHSLKDLLEHGFHKESTSELKDY